MGTFLAIDFEFDVVRRFLFNEQIREGAWVTIQVAVVAQLIGVVLGVLFALMRVARNPLPRFLSGFYVWFFRGTPVLLQLFILYFGVPTLFENQTLTDELTKFRAAIIAFGINEGAYMTEIVRGGILSVESGQMDASRSLGMTQMQAMRRIILPASHSRGLAADRQRVRRDAQEQLDSLGHRPLRAPLRRPDNLLRELQVHGAVGRRRHLVSRLHHRL